MSNELELLKLKAKALSLQKEQKPVPQRNLVGRIADDISLRMQNMRESREATASGQQTSIEGGLQQGAEAAFLLGDIGGEVVQSGLSMADDALGNIPSKAASAAIGAVGSLPSVGGGTIGEAIPQEIGQIQRGVEQFAEESPRLARNLKAGTGLGLLAATVPKQVAGLAKMPVKAAEKITGKNIITKARPNIDALTSENEFGAVLNKARGQADAAFSQNSAQFERAKDLGKDVLIQKNQTLPKIRRRIDEKMFDEGLFINEGSDFSQARGFLDELDKIMDRPERGVPLNQLEKWRRRVTNAQNRATGDSKAALAQIRKSYDEVVEESFEKAVLSGDIRAVDEWAQAIKGRRDLGKKYGTGKGQSALFEKIMRENELDNVQLADTTVAVNKVFGKRGVSGVNETPQFVRRLLDNAGARREEFRENLRNGFLYRAIQKSTEELPGGERIVMPSRLRIELNRLVTESTDTGGIGNDLRKLVFDPEELDELAKLRNNLSDPKDLTGALRRVSTRILGADRITVPEIKFGQNTRKQVEEFLTNFAVQAQPTLRGRALSYGALVGAAELTGDDPVLLLNNGTR